MKVTDKKNKELTLDEQIVAWKEEHKKLFKNVVDGKEYIWRRIRRQ